MLRHERAWWKQGFESVAGVDEAGRGPLAGPVVAACVVLPRNAARRLAGLTDSKQLSALQRDRFYDRIHEVALAVGVAEASPQEIDDRNILQATFLAMRRAIAQVDPVEVVLVDGNRAISEFTLPQETLVKGDARSLSIAAASVIAKVTRDRALLALDAEFPAYGFSQHKGYPTAQHYAALAANGPCPHHRLSFLKRIL